jgi:DNA polymerase-3 subunit alpha
MNLFSMGGAEAAAATVMQLQGDPAEFAEADLQIMEHELLGFYVTSHPLNRVANRLRLLTTHSLRDVSEASDGATVILGGLATGIEKKLTKTNKLLGIVHMEDLLGKLEVVIYSEILEKLPPDVLQPQSLLLVKGKVKKGDDGEISVLASSVRRISDAALVNIHLQKEQNFAELHKLKSILTSFKGDDPVLLHFPRGKRNRMILVGAQFWVSATPDLETRLKSEYQPGVKVQINKVLV